MGLSSLLQTLQAWLPRHQIGPAAPEQATSAVSAWRHSILRIGWMLSSGTFTVSRNQTSQPPARKLLFVASLLSRSEVVNSHKTSPASPTTRSIAWETGNLTTFCSTELLLCSLVCPYRGLMITPLMRQACLQASMPCGAASLT